MSFPGRSKEAGVRLKAVRLWERLPVPSEHVVALVIGLILQKMKPVRLPRGLRPIGWLLLLVGAAMSRRAVRERGGGDLEDPRHLTTHGVHGLTRNPIYVAASSIHIGAALALSAGWVLAIWPFSFALMHRWVLIEERQLAQRFGQEYATYQRRVPRYLGRLQPSPRLLQVHQHPQPGELGVTAPWLVLTAGGQSRRTRAWDREVNGSPSPSSRRPSPPARRRGARWRSRWPPPPGSGTRER